MTTKVYTPKGKIIPFLKEMDRDPERVWTLPEAAVILCIASNGVVPMVTYALRAKRMFRGLNAAGKTILSGRPFPGQSLPVPAPRHNERQRVKKAHLAENWVTTHEDIRVPKVIPGWRPPAMVPPRGC